MTKRSDVLVTTVQVRKGMDYAGHSTSDPISAFQEGLRMRQ